MTNQTEFNERLAASLRESDVLPDESSYKKIQSRIRDIGEQRYQQLDSETAIGAVPESVYTPTDLKRVLGFGQVITEFITLPVGVPRAQRESVVLSGVCVNTYATLFDKFVDKGHNPDSVLSETALRIAGSRLRALQFAYRLYCSAKYQAVFDLVAEEYRSVRSLPHVQSRQSIRGEHDDRVTKMYRAERETVGPAGDSESYRIASVNPFVVMALPAWLATPSLDHERYQRHLDWVEGFGEFIWHLDDAADIVEDEQAGVYNVVASKRGDGRDVTELIADQAATVFSEWRSLSPSSEDTDFYEATLQACIASWLGGKSVL